MQQNETHWQQSLRDAIRDPAELAEMLGLPVDLFAAKTNFPLIVPREFVARMQPGNKQDPLLLQVLPLAQEMLPQSGFSQDPLQETSQNPVPGLLHKYHGRVLLTLAGSCAINCRYCFRRHYAYTDNVTGRNGWQAMLDYIAADNNITEVIYSGGEPLLLTDNLLNELTQKISQINHVKRLRIHTRLPIVIPARVTTELVALLKHTRLEPVVVLHCNHASEIDNQVKLMLQKFSDANIPLLNQAVLLKGVNDDIAAQINLSETLFSANVLPYYLHLLDRVVGAKHFDVNKQIAKTLYKNMQAKLPGYLVPKLVFEQANAPAKRFFSA